MANDLNALREALVKALGQGAQSISYEGRTVTYRNVSDLKAAIAEIDAQIAAGSGLRSPFVVTEYDGA